MDDKLQLLLGASEKEFHPFISSLYQNLVDRNVEFMISTESKVNYNGTSCSGFFEDTPNLLFAVAIGKPFNQWLQIFIHEYCHFEQCMEDPKKFNAINKNINNLFEWVEGKREVDPQTLEIYKKDAIYIEYDCEKRSLKKIIDNKLEKFIDPVLYAQTANSYFNFYHYLVDTKKWYQTGNEPYNLPEVYSKFPKEIKMLDYLSPEQTEAYVACTVPKETKKMKL